jgi:hypothetical protein
VCAPTCPALATKGPQMQAAKSLVVAAWDSRSIPCQQAARRVNQRASPIAFCLPWTPCASVRHHGPGVDFSLNIPDSENKWRETIDLQREEGIYVHLECILSFGGAERSLQQTKPRQSEIVMPNKMERRCMASQINSNSNEQTRVNGTPIGQQFCLSFRDCKTDVIGKLG